MVCDAYVPLVFDAMADYKAKDIYSPENDFNFLMWSVVTWACGRKLRVSGEDIDLSKYIVKHKDGGEYIAFAWTAGDFDWSELSYKQELYSSCGDMNRWCENKFKTWQLDTYYDDREGGWKENMNTDFEYLYEIITGKITRDAAQADKFKRLFDKGYLVTKDGSEYVNIIVALSEEAFSGILPPIPEKLKAASKELDAEIYKIKGAHYPPHMRELCRAWSTDCLAENAVRTRVLEQLTAAGTLKPLSAVQKRSVNTIMFCDTLPMAG